MAHFKITLGDPKAEGNAIFAGAMSRVELNGMDLSSSCSRCVVTIDVHDVVVVELALAATSLQIEGHAQPEITVQQVPLVASPQHHRAAVRLPLADGGYVELPGYAPEEEPR